MRHYPTLSTSRPVSFAADWWMDRPLVLGHRGASAHAPENTVAAFRAADAAKPTGFPNPAGFAGADGVELDVHLTADGVPVVIHNGSVDATTDGHGLVRDMTLHEIQQLDAGSHFDAAFGGERIPTLAEALAAMGDRMRVNIELKPQAKGTGELERAVAKVVYEMQMGRRVWFSSFKPYSLYQIRQFAADIPCALLVSPLTLSSLLLAPVTPMEAIHVHYSLCSKWLVDTAHGLGLRVGVWTVDDAAVAAQLWSYGVDAIITNDPAKLRNENAVVSAADL